MNERARILYVENEETYIRLAEAALGDDFELKVVQTYPDARAHLASGEEHYDLVLVNLNLTKFDDNRGQRILEDICENHASVPRIVVTGQALRGDVVEYIERYQLNALFRKGEFTAEQLCGTVYRILGVRHLQVEVAQRHTGIPKHIVHIYQNEKLKDYERLQLFEFTITDPTEKVAEVSIEFQEQRPYVQRTTRHCVLKSGRGRICLSPLFTAQVADGGPIAVSNIRILAGGQRLWECRETYIFEVVDEVPLQLRQAEIEDSWVHFLIAACITPKSPKVVELASQVRTKWGSEHPSSIWNASEYTEADAFSAVCYLYDLLKDKLIAEGTYIPDAPQSQELVEHTIRLPDEVLLSGGANCLSFSLVYASVMENLGIQPLLLFMPAHVMPGWKRTRSDASHAFEPANFKFLNENCFFIESTETSLDSSFTQMLEKGKRTFRKAQELRASNQPVYLLDVAKLRSEGITPCRG
jgi:CheY-like chemotaxis protein